MTLFDQRRLLEESIQYKYFKAIEISIFNYSQAGNEEKRLQVVEIYNKLSSIKHRILITPLDDEIQAVNMLNGYKQQIKDLLLMYKKVTGESLTYKDNVLITLNT